MGTKHVVAPLSSTQVRAQQHNSVIPGGSTTLLAGAGVVAAAAIGGALFVGMRLAHGPSTPGAIEGIEVMANPKIAMKDVLHGVRYLTPPGEMKLFGVAGGVQLSHLERPLNAVAPTVADGAAAGGGASPAAATPSLFRRMLARMGIGGDRLLNQVDQGALGDCWLDASIGAKALAQPDVVERMVADPVHDVAKIRDIATRVPGVAKLLDASPAVKQQLADYVLVETPEGAKLVHKALPFRAGTPAYAGTNGEALWPSYLEKTAAGMTGGSYKSIEGGWPREGWKLLFGDNPQEIARPASAVEFIRGELKDGRAVAFTSINSPRADDTLEKGLFGNHTYIPRTVNGEGPAATVDAFNPWGVKHPKPLTEEDLKAMSTTVESDRSWFQTS